jgi:hypothetical protein
MTSQTVVEEEVEIARRRPRPAVQQLIVASPGTACGGRFSDTTGKRIQARSEASVCCFELPSWRRNYSSASWKAPRVLDLCNWRGQHIED